MHPPTLNSCIVPNACKKIEIMKIKVKLDGHLPKKTLGCLPTSTFVYCHWLDAIKLIDPLVGSPPLSIPDLFHRSALACDHLP